MFLKRVHFFLNKRAQKRLGIFRYHERFPNPIIYVCYTILTDSSSPVANIPMPNLGRWHKGHRNALFSIDLMRIHVGAGSLPVFKKQAEVIAHNLFGQLLIRCIAGTQKHNNGKPMQ